MLQAVVAIAISGIGVLFGTGILKPQIVTFSRQFPQSEVSSQYKYQASYWQQGATSAAVDEIYVSLIDRTVSVYKNRNLIKTYPIVYGMVAVGTKISIR